MTNYYYNIASGLCLVLLEICKKNLADLAEMGASNDSLKHTYNGKLIQILNYTDMSVFK